MMVSIKDIASRCNVSVATVSKALNGAKDVSEETRARIRQVADEMGYSSNAAARALKTNRTYNIGVLFVDKQSSGLTHEYFSAILDSFKAHAEVQGYSITFINHFVGKRKTSYLQHCLYKGLDGVLIACVDFEDPDVVELVNSKLPVVTIDYIFNGCTSILSDNAEGMSKLVRYAYQMGHRKLGVIHGEMTNVTQLRMAGFYRTCQELGIEVADEYIRPSRYHDPKGCEMQTKALLELPEPPTCIFFQDDFSGIGGLEAIQAAGLQIPEDISVIGYDGIRLSRVLHPHLTTCWQDTETLGKLSAERLIQTIEHPKTTIPEQLIVSSKLYEGGSVKQLDLTAGTE